MKCKPKMFTVDSEIAQKIFELRLFSLGGGGGMSQDIASLLKLCSPSQHETTSVLTARLEPGTVFALE